jgi:2',3'-cyclic-nucleotide 2'-phosphodiesterase (5'-nucleotidase family)
MLRTWARNEAFRRTPMWVVIGLAFAGPCPVAAYDSLPVQVSIVGTNDLHGKIDALPTLGGYLNNLRAARSADGGTVLLLDAGDMFQGTMASNLGEGQVVVEAYNKLGYTAAAIGNHEFDFGPVGTGMQGDARGALRARARQAKFPFLAANVWETENAKPWGGDNIVPSALIQVKGISIGLIGITTIDTPKSTLAENFAGLTVRPLIATVIAEAKALRAKGATVIVVVAHAGGDCSQLENPNDIGSCKTAGAQAEIMDLAKGLPAGTVDAIVAGHTHAAVAHVVANIPIIESYASGRAFGRIDLWVDAKSKRVERHSVFAPQNLCRAKPTKHGGACVTFEYEGAPVLPDGALQEFVNKANREVHDLASQPLGAVAATAIRRDYDGESALGNLLVDLTRAARPKADVALANGGGIRKDIPAGPVTYESLYEVMPFDNTFATAVVRGEELKRVFEHNLRSRGGFLSQAGLRISSTCIEGKLKVQLFRDDGKAVADDETLTVVTNSFLATGGDGVLAGLPFEIEAGPPIRDELARVAKQRGGKWVASELFLAKTPRHSYPGKRPVFCK